MATELYDSVAMKVTTTWQSSIMAPMIAMDVGMVAGIRGDVMGRSRVATRWCWIFIIATSSPSYLRKVRDDEETRLQINKQQQQQQSWIHGSNGSHGDHGKRCAYDAPSSTDGDHAAPSESEKEELVVVGRGEDDGD
nr:hypothetical protein CFP56_65869 [Quercus suber]